MPRLVLSLDYDGNACILFKDALEDCNKYKGHFRMRPCFEPTLLEIRAVLDHFLDDTVSGADSVDLYVGSNRQSHKLDAFNMKANQNGSCFTNYEKLAQKKGWIFRRLLLGDNIELNSQRQEDVTNVRKPPLPAGSTMADPSIEAPYDTTKIAIIKYQLEDLARHYPDEEVEFYFMDDDHKDIIIPTLKEHFEKHPQDIPRGITLHLIKFDWFPTLEKHMKEGSMTSLIKASIEEHARNAIQECAVLKGAEFRSSGPEVVVDAAAETEHDDPPAPAEPQDAYDQEPDDVLTDLTSSTQKPLGILSYTKMLSASSYHYSGMMGFFSVGTVASIMTLNNEPHVEDTVLFSIADVD